MQGRGRPLDVQDGRQGLDGEHGPLCRQLPHEIARAGEGAPHNRRRPVAPSTSRRGPSKDRHSPSTACGGGPFGTPPDRLRKPYSTGSGSRVSAERAELLTAFCSFSNARTSIWRMRSRLTPYSAESSSSVAGSSFSRRSVEDVALAVVEVAHRLLEAACGVAELLALGQPRLPGRRLVDQPVLPLAGLRRRRASAR